VLDSWLSVLNITPCIYLGATSHLYVLGCWLSVLGRIPCLLSEYLLLPSRARLLASYARSRAISLILVPFLALAC